MMRAIDLVLAVLAMIILLPLFIVIVPILRLTGEGEVLYLQQRIGRYGKRFNVIKFATMVKNSPNIGSGSITIKNDPRILPVGKFLRSSKLNELPQLINVVRGEMSLIGPRPHVERDLKGVDKEVLKEVLELRPGLSGIASIIFRNEDKILHKQVSARQFYDDVLAPYKSQLDLWYSRHISLKYYFILILYTVLVVFGLRPSNIFTRIDHLPEVPVELKQDLL